MENRGKVTNLVKKFNNTKPVKNDSQNDSKSTKDLRKKSPNTKGNKRPDEDEISVSVDVGEEGIIDLTLNKPKIKTRSKKYIHHPTDSKGNLDNEKSHPSDNENTKKPESILSQNQNNPIITAMGPIKESDSNDVSKLSPWLSDRINQLPYDTQYYPNPKQRTISTDTFELDRRHEEEMRLLKETIDDVECQLKIKDREIETNNWIKNEMEKRLQNTNDLFALKQQLKDHQRNQDAQERQIQDLTKENVQLYDDMSSKDRKIMELQSEVNNLDKIMANKAYLEESEKTMNLLEQIDELRKDILEKEIEINNNQQQIFKNVKDIEKKDLEMHYLNKKCNDLESDMEKHQDDITNRDKKQFTLVESLKAKERENGTLLENAKKIEDFERKWESLEDENLFLKQSLHELEDQCKALEKRQESSFENYSLMEELQQALVDRNQIKERNTQLSEQLRAAESMLKEKTYQEMALKRENNQLKSFIDDLEEENGLYRKFENDINDLDAQLRESERTRNALEGQLVQIKPQIQRLQVKSLEKDHLIIQLVQELKSQMGYLPTDLRKEINKNDIQSITTHERDVLGR